MNLFATALTYAAPSANYRGEGAENRAVIQKITCGRFEYAIISPEAIRNALRETLAEMGLPCNRSRLHDEEQLAVQFQDYPDAEQYADDFFMGWLIAATGKDREKILAEVEKKGRNRADFTFKRDSVLRMNMARSLEPYRHDSVFTQSPLNVNSPWKNADSSQLLHRETVVTPYQYPFALNLEECRAGERPTWTKQLLKAVGQLNNVAGNHARSYFEMAPASVVVRLTKQLVAGFDTYGFQVAEDGAHAFPEVVEGVLKDDYPGEEFWIGGKIVKDMEKADAEAREAARGKPVEESAGQPPNGVCAALEAKGVHLDRSPQRTLEAVGNAAFDGQ